MHHNEHLQFPPTVYILHAHTNKTKEGKKAVEVYYRLPLILTDAPLFTSWTVVGQ